MDRTPKLLILYGSAGHGHEKAARALQKACLARTGVEPMTLDVLKLAKGFFGEGYKRSYLFMIQSAPWLWGFFYFLLDNPFVYLLIKPLRRVANSLFARGVARAILKENPDAILLTHFLPCEVAAHLKRTGSIQSKLVTIVTDYQPHLFWIERETDLYAVALEETRDELVRRGVPADRIAVTGIPVEPKFGAARSRQEARAALGLAGRFTALVTGGGAGVGGMRRMALELVSGSEGAQVLVVCGTNRRLHEQLTVDARRRQGLKVYGFVDNMQELMSAADVIVGKGGGLTISESLALGRPLVLFRPVPGQETRNADSVRRAGAARVASSLADVVVQVRELAASPAVLEVMHAKAAAVGKPRAADAVLDRVLL